MTLTPDNNKPLDELFAHVPPSVRSSDAATQPDFLQTWFGVSGSELKAKLMTLIRQERCV